MQVAANKAYNVLLSVALFAVLLAGCQKHFNLRFVNETLEARDVMLAAPGHGSIPVGRIDGGTHLTHRLAMRPEHLPSRCWWNCGEISGNFVLTDEQRGPIVVPIRAPGPISSAASMPATSPVRTD